MQDLINRFKDGDQRALARLISKLENETPDREQYLKDLYFSTGRAKVIGATGAPGAGKSSLVDQLTRLIRKKGETVGIIAVDPTSPFTGGALLGDRIRMNEHAGDKGVFIRSMGTRGSLGGLAKSTKEAVKAMDAFGLDWIIVETVGVGQAELDIIYLADTIMVVLTPASGDAIQTLKAGIMEIADIFVVNKSDLPGADKITQEIQVMLDQNSEHMKWRPPVVQVSVMENFGVDELLANIDKHHKYLKDNELMEEKRRQRAKAETLEIVNYRWQQMVKEYSDRDEVISDILEKVINMDYDPYAGAAYIIEHLVSKYSKEGSSK